jgi:hypothetical protein
MCQLGGKMNYYAHSENKAGKKDKNISLKFFCLIGEANEKISY